MVKLINCNTGASVTFDVAIQIGGESATIDGPESFALYDTLGAWGKPGGVADAEFDLETGGAVLRRCCVEGIIGPRGLTIGFMERE